MGLSKKFNGSLLDAGDSHGTWSARSQVTTVEGTPSVSANHKTQSITLMKKQLLIGLAVILTSLLTAPSQAANRPAKGVPIAPTLTQAAQAALVYALDGEAGEYMARAEYKAIIAKFGPVQPFVNILRAEEKHIAALQQQCIRYGVTIPMDTKTGTAPETLLEAATIGVVAELANVEMYEETLLPAVAAYPSLVTVFTNLRDASELNHLPAFEAAVEVLENGGVLPTARIR